MFKRSVLGLVMVVLGVLAVSAPAGVISMNVVTLSENFLSPDYTGTNYTAGVVPAAGWNDSVIPSGAWMYVHDDAGNWNGAEFTMSYTTYAPTEWHGYSTLIPTEPDNKLLSGHIYNPAGTNTVAGFRNIPYAAYDVYVYYNSAAITDNYQTFTIVENGMSAVGSELTTTPDAGFVLSNGTNDANYVKFSNVNLSAFTIQASATSGYSYFNGFQIVEVPEPMTLCLLALGGLFLRRKS